MHARKAFYILTVFVKIETEWCKQELSVRSVLSRLGLEPCTEFVCGRRHRTSPGCVILQSGLQKPPAREVLVLRHILIQFPLNDQPSVFQQVLAD